MWAMNTPKSVRHDFSGGTATWHGLRTIHSSVATVRDSTREARRNAAESGVRLELGEMVLVCERSWEVEVGDNQR